MTDKANTFTRELTRLRLAYVARMPEELKVLSELARQLTGKPSDRPLLVELHQRLHKLAGSGSTFGLSQLSARARHLEQTASRWLATDLNAAELARDEFIGAVNALASTLSSIDDLLTPPHQVDTTENTQQQAQLWLVESDASLGHELSRLLNQFGYQVHLFSELDATETENSKPDVLIMDMQFEQTSDNNNDSQLRARLETLACPLLFITEQGDFNARIRAARLGADGFLLKPLDIPKLVDRLETILGEQQVAPYRVLIVDDDVELGEHYRLVLAAAGMRVMAETQPEKVIDSISSFRPELVLMDLRMPGYSGPELATVIRQFDEWVGLPIVYLSSETNLDEQIRALGHGADDFLTKPISDAQLVAAVHVRATRSRQLTDLMSRDSLTGLLKHARIKEELGIALVRTGHSGKPLSVAMIDIDHFKKVNDSYGHAVGDRVIRAVAQLLRQRLRKSDIIGRYGGEEFATLLPECDLQAAHDILDDVRQGFASLHFNHEGKEFSCTLSTGIACSSELADTSGDNLLIAADERLYQAKHAGRNQICISNPTSAADDT